MAERASGLAALAAGPGQRIAERLSGLALRLTQHRPGWRLAPGLALAAAAASLGLHLLVQHEARGFVRAEIGESARQAVSAFDAAVTDLAHLLSWLSAGGAPACSTAFLDALRQSALSDPAVGDFALVAESGMLMCSASDREPAPARLLPPLDPRSPALAILPDPRPERATLLVARTTENGTRLTAILAPDLPRLPVVPAFAQGLASTTIGPPAAPWRAAGPPESGASSVVVARASGLYSFEAAIALPGGAAPAAFRRLDAAILIAGMAGMIGAFAFALRTRPSGIAATPVATAAAAARATGPISPLYRAVFEIDGARMIGIDLELRTGDGGIASEATLIDLDDRVLHRVLAEIAPLLRRTPSLMLSLRAECRDPERLEGAVRRLADAARPLGVDADQMVVGLIAHAGAEGLGRYEAALETLRMLGFRVAIDRIILGDPDWHAALRRHPPEFLLVNIEPLLAGLDHATAVGLLKATVAAARWLAMGVVASQVGDRAQAMALLEAGITSASGAAFGQALNARDVHELGRLAAAPAGNGAFPPD